jgi:hypothetical protein
VLVRMLFVEDVATDAELAVRRLQLDGVQCTHKRVETEPDFPAALRCGRLCSEEQLEAARAGDQARPARSRAEPRAHRPTGPHRAPDRRRADELARGGELLAPATAAPRLRGAYPGHRRRLDGQRLGGWITRSPRARSSTRIPTGFARRAATGATIGALRGAFIVAREILQEHAQ